MVPLNITLVGKQLVEWAPPHSIWIILLPMRRLPLQWLFKAPSSSVHCKHGKGDHWKGGRDGTRRGAAFIFFFLGLPDTVQDLPWGRGREARNHGVPLWVLWLSQGNRNMHNCDIGLFFLEAISSLRLPSMVIWRCAIVCVYACSMLTGNVCRDGVMRRGAPSVRFAFRLVYLHSVLQFSWEKKFFLCTVDEMHTVLLVGWPNSCH